MDISITIPFPSPETAQYAFDVLNVDKELNKSRVERKIVTDAENLKVTFYGEDLKRLRVGVNAFIKNVLLVVKTIEQF